MSTQLRFVLTGVSLEGYRLALQDLRQDRADDLPWEVYGFSEGQEHDQPVGRILIRIGSQKREKRFVLAGPTLDSYRSALAELALAQADGLEVHDAGFDTEQGQPVGTILLRETQGAGARALARRSVWSQRRRRRRAVPRVPGRAKPRGPAPRARRAVAPGEIRILCIHGVGHGDVDPNLIPNWTRVLIAQLRAANPALNPTFQFLKYDHLFDQSPHNVFTYAEAFARLSWSGITSLVGGLFGRRGGLADGSDAVRWSAGMVAQWAENDELRARTRTLIAQGMADFQPDLVVAHSLGTLISYDTFARVSDDRGRAWPGPDLIKGRFYVSLGSQIGNPFTRQTLGGRIQPLAARHWFHLYNPHDNAFTAPIKIVAPNFDQIVTRFDIDGFLDHEATEYLNHRLAADSCWRSIALAAPEPAAPRGRGLSPEEKRAAAAAQRISVLRPPPRARPRRRALLVGINDYPNPADRLEGCVNDVFLMSSLLQENGFAPEDIRVVLNERATASGILERLEWLVEGADDTMERVFYYSGHGAQIPGYGVGEKVDRKDECLVAYDFDWSRGHAVTDDQFFDLYSQLSYQTRLLAILDCCHSGGMARDGGPRVRGLSPPDDIRHRALRWEADEEMWVPRDFGQANRELGRLFRQRKERANMFGSEGNLHKLGCGAGVRPEKKAFARATKAFDHRGPFMPIILQACQEKQYSYEYRHGVQSYGAFTYSLAQLIREKRKANAQLTWQQMVTQIGTKLRRLHYDQRPGLICSRHLKTAPVPWLERM